MAQARSPVFVVPFDLAFRTLFAQTQELAFAQTQIPVGSIGSVSIEVREGGEYAYWRGYDPAGKLVRQYIGPAGDAVTRARVAELEGAIADAAGLARSSLALRRQGFAQVDNSTGVTLAALFNAGALRSGAILVGTHAFGVLTNLLGVRQPPGYLTEDLDIARAGPIEVAALPQGGFLELLRTSGLPFVEVPELDVRKPATSFKVRGRTLKVDLLVPAKDERYATVRVPELGAHATGLPHLAYLLVDPVRAITLGRDRVIPVQVPQPARYCVHKLVVAGLRTATSTAKKEKDIWQAAFLAAALHESREGDIERAVAALRGRARARARAPATRAVALLQPAHQPAAAILRRLTRD